MNPSRVQSVLDGAPGSAAAVLHDFGLALYAGGALILIAVIALAIYSVFSQSKSIAWQRWIIGGGIVFPVATLSAVLVYSLHVGNVLHTDVGGSALRIHVTGKQWWWEVRYETADGQGSVVLANELHIPVGRPVELQLATHDVIHSFWVPSLAGKVDMIPGRTNQLVLYTQERGLFRGQCAEYCGGQHALMALYVVAQPPDDFRRWLEREAQPVIRPTDPMLMEGYELFFRGGCNGCHTVRGTPAAGQLGPDLTHVGSRHSLGAGILDNHVGTMAGWIAAAQDVKPGNFMPSLNIYTGHELRAISAWLESLE